MQKLLTKLHQAPAFFNKANLKAKLLRVNTAHVFAKGAPKRFVPEGGIESGSF